MNCDLEINKHNIVQEMKTLFKQFPNLVDLKRFPKREGQLEASYKCHKTRALLKA